MYMRKVIVELKDDILTVLFLIFKLSNIYEIQKLQGTKYKTRKSLEVRNVSQMPIVYLRQIL